MTREEAIKELKIQFVGEYDRQREAKDMAIKALEQETVSREVYESEYLARKQAEYELWKIKEQEPPVTPVACIAEIKFSKEDIQKLVDEKMKDIVIERKVGKWTEVDTNMYTCSNCSHCFTIVPKDNQIQQFKYCPNCGSFMGE